METTWRTRVREAWARLRGGELTPWRAAASVAVGLAIGVTPLWGFHLPLVLAVCVPLRLDAPVAYLAANVSLPFVAPFLSFAEIDIGAWARTGHGLPLSVTAIRERGVGEFVKELVVGTAIFAPLVALAGGTLAYVIASGVKGARAASGDSTGAAVARVAERYGRGSRGAYYYVRSKLAGDPVARAVVTTAGPGGSLGEVVDVGCGRGQLAVLLLEAGAATRAAGFDWDESKIADARSAAEGLAATFAVGDVRRQGIAPCDSVLLVDVLHYLTHEEQESLLARAARAARTRVIVRDLDPDRGWRSVVTRVQEAVTTAVRFNRGARVKPLPIARVVRTLEAEGFAVTVEPCWGSTPFANVLIVATRAPER